MKYGIIFWENSSNIPKVFPLQKRMTRIKMGVGSRCSCRALLKKLDILPVPCTYVFSLMVFTVSNLDNFQINSVMHRANTRANTSCIDPV